MQHKLCAIDTQLKQIEYFLKYSKMHIYLLSMINEHPEFLRCFDHK